MPNSRTRCVLLLVDGLRPDVAEARLAAGELPHLAPCCATGGRTRAITVFPSTTSVAYLPFLTGCTPGPLQHSLDPLARPPRLRRPLVAGAGGGAELLRLPGAAARRRHRARRAHDLRAGARERRHLHAGRARAHAGARPVAAGAAALGRAGALRPVAPAVGRRGRAPPAPRGGRRRRGSCSPSSPRWTATPTRPIPTPSRCAARCARWMRSSARLRERLAARGELERHARCLW